MGFPTVTSLDLCWRCCSLFVQFNNPIMTSPPPQTKFRQNLSAVRASSINGSSSSGTIFTLILFRLATFGPFGLL
ncbi:hypothetical protein LIER_36724 [Lithospermum erythrorhizon]|uniref:Uncharacterized protein n=1 Tax=Lithospermum erythrorhizon TaxID=34254 RepID=A0AAV3PE68_LITER